MMVRLWFSLACAALCFGLRSAPAHARPILTEVAWAGSAASANDEWIEIYNPDVGPLCDLSAFVLVEGTTVRPLPFAAVASGAFLVLEKSPGATPLEAPAALPLTGLSLNNSGEALRLCPAGTPDDLATCDVVHTAGAWPAGSNTTKATMERVDAAAVGTLETSWQNANPATPGTAAYAGTVGDLDGCLPADAGVVEPDAGPSADAGVGPADAGPNQAPALTLAAPSGEVVANEGFAAVRYTASDADLGDLVSVDLFFSEDSSGNTGVQMAAGLPGGADRLIDVTTVGLPAGTWHVFGRATDLRGAATYAYAPGTVVTPASNEAAATFRLTNPDGVNDTDAAGQIGISFDVALPVGTSGSVSLFLDDDDNGANGTPIVAGLDAAQAGPRAYVFDPVARATAPGTYFPYGVLSWTGGEAVSYAPASIQIDQPGLTCTHTPAAGGADVDTGLIRNGGVAQPRSALWANLLGIGTLAILLLHRRSGRWHERRNRTTCDTGLSPTSTATSKR